MKTGKLIAYAAAHFLVDFGCALLLFGRVCPNSDPMVALLLYNLFAFAVQMPVGLLADRLGKSHVFAAAGCFLVFTAWLLPVGMAAAVTAGLGNAAFHVGGGLYALNEKEHRAGPLGLFVSPGAFGVYLGGRLAFSFSPLFLCGMLAVMGILLLVFGAGEKNAPLALPEGDFGLFGAAFCLFAVVVLRSLLGLAADLPWKSEMGFLAVCAVAGGKAAGGYLADRFGRRTVAYTSLGVAAICFLGGENPVLGLAALFLFNMTMPLTLWAMAKLFPGAKGFSFGLLTFALFLGFLPVYFGYGGMGSVTLTLGTAVSLPLLALGLRYAERGQTEEAMSEGTPIGTGNAEKQPGEVQTSMEKEVLWD